MGAYVTTAECKPLKGIWDRDQGTGQRPVQMVRGQSIQETESYFSQFGMLPSLDGMQGWKYFISAGSIIPTNP